VCGPDGGILDDVLVYKWASGFGMVVNAGNRAKLIAWLDVHRAGRGVEMYDQTFDTALIAVQGPKATDLLRDLFDTDVGGLKYYHATAARFNGTDCVVSRTGYTGEDGYEIRQHADASRTFWDLLVSRGAVPCGLGARDSLRLEAGMPLYGHELSESVDPFSAGLGWAVKLEKEFIGRDSLISAKDDVSQGKTRIGLVLDGKRAAREGSGIETPDGRPVGTVTSGSYAPTLEQSIAMGYVESGCGDQLVVDIRGSNVPAKVVPLPFYKRAK
jgi:aminomethyltransferase